MSADLRLLIDSLDRVRMRLSADHALAVFVNSSPSEEELEIAATHFAAWQHEHTHGAPVGAASAPAKERGAIMRFNHFCRTSDLDSIAEKGLYPRVPHEPQMSLGLSVVWLTTSETTAVAEGDIAHFRTRRFSETEIEEIRQHGWLLDTGRTHRFTIRVRSDHKLINYGTFLRQNADTVIVDENGVAHANDAGELYSVRHMMEGLSPSCLATWWVYFGRIPPSKIEGLPSRQRAKTPSVAVEEDTALDIALNKFIRSETATPPELRVWP